MVLLAEPTISAKFINFGNFIINPHASAGMRMSTGMNEKSLKVQAYVHHQIAVFHLCDFLA
jgi:hypothetical protein